MKRQRSQHVVLGLSVCLVAAVACGSTTDRAIGGDAAPGMTAEAGADAADAGVRADAADGGGPAPSRDAGSPVTARDAASPEACDAAAPPAPASGVSFAIDMTKGPSRQFQPPPAPAPISPYVYGINGFGPFVAQKTRWGLIRQGGDAYTAYNWTINYLNSGGDYCYWQGQAGGGSALAGAIAVTTSSNGDSIPAAQAKGEAYLATVPIGDRVSAAHSNNTGIDNLCPAAAACKGGASSLAVNSGNLDFASVDPGSTAFVANAARKGRAFCLCAPGQACAVSTGGGCTVSTGPVYQDEFVNYIKTTFGSGGAPIFFMLDNEPNYWGGTHPEVWPFTGTVPCQGSNVSFDDIVTRDTTFAAAIKAAWPGAKVFGPVVAGDGVVYAHGYTDPHLPTEFLDYYLAQMAAASATAGRPLLDVLDIHYYNPSSTAAQCVQNPRMFWDPGYTSLSASATDAIDFGWSGVNGYFDTSWYPRKVIPRVLAKIANASFATAPGLSFSEYNSGCEASIAGAVAEADDLGVFGREGVFAATAWPLQSLTTNYLVAAYDLYRNYGGNGETVGDTSVRATTTDVTGTSVYAFAHSDDPSAVDVVAINKETTGVPVSIAIAHPPPLRTVTLYDLVDGAAAVVPVAGAPPALSCTCAACTLSYTMPAMSATTLVLR
jgi:Glycoside hydrolase family 44